MTATPPTVTELAPEKYVPVIIEVVPPLTSPTAADATEVIVGALSHWAYSVVFAVIEKVAPARY